MTQPDFKAEARLYAVEPAILPHHEAVLALKFEEMYEHGMRDALDADPPHIIGPVSLSRDRVAGWLEGIDDKESAIRALLPKEDEDG